MGCIIGGLMSEMYFYNADPNEGNFTYLNNTCIRDTRLSLKAKGLHTYLMSLPKDWKLYKTELVKHSRDGIDSVNSALKELVEFGYIEITEQKRSDSGKFSGNGYGCHAIPSKELSKEIVNNTKQKTSEKSHRNGFPVTEKPSTVTPVTGNPLLLNTNKLNIDKQITELTNSESEIVSESVFVNIIKDLFSGEYPFDNKFESDVLKQLSESKIEESNLEPYLKYVFDRTKLGNVRKSFEGLFRTLALSKSIVRDFKNSSFFKKTEVEVHSKSSFHYFDCPICASHFDADGRCPKCDLSPAQLKDKSLPEYIANQKIYNMTEDERAKYESALLERREQHLVSKKTSVLNPNELIQFWTDYGLID